MSHSFQSALSDRRQSRKTSPPILAIPSSQSVTLSRLLLTPLLLLPVWPARSTPIAPLCFPPFSVVFRRRRRVCVLTTSTSSVPRLWLRSQQPPVVPDAYSSFASFRSHTNSWSQPPTRMPSPAPSILKRTQIRSNAMNHLSSNWRCVLAGFKPRQLSIYTYRWHARFAVGAIPHTRLNLQAAQTS